MSLDISQPSHIQPGAEKASADLNADPVRALRVLFFATRDALHPETTGGDITLWEFARYLAARGANVTYVSASYPGVPLNQRLEGINVVRLGGIHTLWMRSFIYYMRYARRKHDIVITEGFGGSRIPRLAPFYVREPLITEWFQLHRDLFSAQYPRLLNGPLNVLERFTIWVHRNTLVRALTEDWAAAYAAAGFKRSNVFVVPVSLQPEWMSSPGDDAAPRQPWIVWIGKLRRYKNPDHLVRAMPGVAGRVPAARLILAIRRDDVAYENELRELSHRLGVADKVDFRLNISEWEKRELLQTSKVLGLPSAVEGFGIVVLEANACGVPVVASSGVPTGAVTDGANGLRYRYGDISGLTEQLIALLTDETLHSRMAANGRRFATGFMWNDVSAQYADIVVRAAASRMGLGPTRIPSGATLDR